MLRWSILLSLLVVAGVASAPAAHARDGSIYKCSIDGRTVYRDTPCSGTKPNAGKLSGPDFTDDGGNISNDPVVLVNQLMDFGQRKRKLQAQQRREVNALKARMTGVPDPPRKRQEVQQFKDKWQQRFAAQKRRKNALLARLKQVCPGAQGTRDHITCGKRSDTQPTAGNAGH